MPTTIERIWTGDLTAMGGRKDKRSSRYQAFMPDRIADVDPRVTFEAAELALRAEDAIRELNSRAGGAGLKRSDPCSCGPRQSPPRASRDTRRHPSTWRGHCSTLPQRVEPLERSRATSRPCRQRSRSASARELTVEGLLDIHRTLMQDEPDAFPGEFRVTQGWIGGRAASPLGADYIPPPEDAVPEPRR